MKIFQNLTAKKTLKNMNESLYAVFEAPTPEQFESALEHAQNIHEKAERSLSDEFLFPENTDKANEKVIFSKNVWLNLDTIKFLQTQSNSIISETLIHSIGSFYIQPDKHVKMLFANFVLDGLIMAQYHYKNNWIEYMTRYFEIQNNITQFVEKYVKSNDSWSSMGNHPFNYQYPAYYFATSLKQYDQNNEITEITHYDRALVKLALLNARNNPDKAEGFIKQAVDLYGQTVVNHGESKYFLSPLNAILFDDDDDRLAAYSFITNCIEKLTNKRI